MHRRAFFSCGAAIAALSLARPVPGGQLFAAPRIQLLWEGQEPLLASRLVPHRTYVFAYPFEGTPCFLLDLGRAVPPVTVNSAPAVGAYAWPGGTGRGRTIVAYSAICPHALTHPTREVAMIRHYPPGAAAAIAQQGGVIACCAHGSTFDPGRGAVPLQPPAEQPLAAVVLAWDDAEDTLHAEGVIGHAVFGEFFRAFPTSARRAVPRTTAVWDLERYSRGVLSC